MSKTRKVSTIFNLNYTVYVKLDERGYDRLSRYYTALGTPYTIADLKAKADKDGYTSIQGWRLIKALGGSQMIDGACGFDMNIKLSGEGVTIP